MLKPLLFCLLFLLVNTQRNPKRNLIRTLPFREVLDSIYNVYDPSYLSVVWPTIRNGVHVAFSADCFEELKVFFKDFSKGRAWALIAADASGHYNSGVYSGRRHWLGSKQQCLDLDQDMDTKKDNEFLKKFRNDVYLNDVLRKEFTQGQDRETRKTTSGQDELMQKAFAAISSPPHRLAYTTARLTLNVTKVSMAKRHEIVQGMCLPRSCSTDDVAAILNFSIMITDTIRTNRTIPRSVKIMSTRRIEKYNINADITALSLISITLFLLLLSVIATLLDYNVIKCRRHAKTKSFNVQKYNNDLKCESKSNLFDMETLTINNIVNTNNINLVTVKKVIKPNAVPPSITLDVVSSGNGSNSCKRCGKYKKQCVNPKAAEIINVCPRVKYNSFASLNVDKRNLYQYLLLCFSLNYSWKRMFNTNMANKDLSIMHGLRIVTTIWVVFIHVATLASYLSDGATDLNSHNNVYIILTTGSLAFDTLFFVSGLFSSYHFFYLKSQYSVEELVSFGGTCGQVLQLCCFITNRAVRLLPSYAYVIFLSAVLARVSRRTCVLELPDRDYNCDTTWWRNILYITNVYPVEERCMQISWYLTSETQLHAVGALLCAIAARRRVALTLASLAVLGATAADVTSAFWEYGKPISGVFPLYRLLMERPWARVAPYFIGVFGGWLVRRMGGKLTVSRLISSCLWLASLAALVIASAVPWVGPAWTGAWLHLVWPAVLLWPALVCATDYAGLCRRLLDSGAVAALSRMSYSVLLTHGVVTRTVLLSLDGALCSSTMCIFSYFAGTTLLTLLASLLLSLLVEMPCCSLLRRLSDCATLKS